MYRTNRSFAVLRAAVVAAPLLLAMGGCAVVPLAELASSEAGRAGMQSALHSFLPATAPDAATPCEAAATRPPAIGCDKVAARKDTQRRQ